MKKSLTEQLATIGNAINGVLNNPEIMEILALYGYTEARIRTEGLAAFETVQKIFLAQQKEYGEQYTATEQTNALLDKAYATYIPLLKLSRIALKNHHGALSSIGAEGNRKQSISGVIKEARVFYQNLSSQPALLDVVASFGITPNKLVAGLEEVAALEVAHQTFLKEKGEAQEATLLRDQALDSLHAWYSDFRAVSRIALAERSQLLEKMGIVAKR